MTTYAQLRADAREYWEGQVEIRMIWARFAKRHDALETMQRWVREARQANRKAREMGR
jgi:hypothetical protein